MACSTAVETLTPPGNVHVHDTGYVRFNRIPIATAILCAWSALVSTILLTWLMRKP